MGAWGPHLQRPSALEVLDELDADQWAAGEPVGQWVKNTGYLKQSEWVKGATEPVICRAFFLTHNPFHPDIMIRCIYMQGLCMMIATKKSPWYPFLSTAWVDERYVNIEGLC